MKRRLFSDEQLKWSFQKSLKTLSEYTGIDFPFEEVKGNYSPVFLGRGHIFVNDDENKLRYHMYLAVHLDPLGDTYNYDEIYVPKIFTMMTIIEAHPLNGQKKQIVKSYCAKHFVNGVDISTTYDDNDRFYINVDVEMHKIEKITDIVMGLFYFTYDAGKELAPQILE